VLPGKREAGGGAGHRSKLEPALRCGVFRFSTPTEAAEALAAVNAEYERHRRTAREIAEIYFGARQTAESILPATLT